MLRNALLVLAVSFILLATAMGARPKRSVYIPERPDDPPAPLSLSLAANPVFHPVKTIVMRGPYISFQVNVDANGFNIPGDAANEPSIAVDSLNPDNMAIGWRQFDTIASNFRQAGVGYTKNGGKKWTFPGVLDAGVFRSDPVLAADDMGNFYYLSLKVVGSDYECGLFYSSDGGMNWGGPTFAYGGDKSWLGLDITMGIGNGNLYQAWNVAGNPYYPNTFCRSTSGGTFWSSPQTVPNQPVFGTVAVGPDGEIYVAGCPNSYYTNEFYVVKSTDAKDPSATPSFTWKQVNMNGYFTLMDGPNPAGLLGQVWVAVNHAPGPLHGEVYLLSICDPAGNDPMDIHFSRSEDGGQTWSPAVRVNDDNSWTNAWQWFGTMSVAPNGRIDVIWNDTRSSGLTNICELYYAWSYDGGQTWSKNVPVSPKFNSHLGWPNQDKLGDYYDMVSDDTGAYIAYSATFNGEQDVYFLKVFPK